MSMMLRRKMMAASPYQKIGWIGTDSSALRYIQTNYIPVQYDEVSLQFSFQSSSMPEYGAIFSAGADDYQFIMLFGTNKTVWWKYFQTGGADRFDKTFSRNTWYDVVTTSDGKLTTNGKTLQSGYEGALDGDSTALRLFYRANDTSPFYGRLKKFTITNNGTTKINLVPSVRKSDGKPGMLDTVSGTFYTNAAGADDFIIPT